MQPQKKQTSFGFAEDDFDEEAQDNQILRVVGTVYKQEHVYSNAVENIADKLTQKYTKFHSTPWYTLLYLTTIVHGVLTMLLCFYKTDFINLSILIMLLHVRYNSDQIKRI